MSESYVKHGSKSEIMESASRAIRESLATNHPGHTIETFVLNNGFELWCLTCDEKAASATIEEVP